MPYFFILPVFGIVVLLLGGLALACRAAPSLRPMFPFAWRILLWSTVGVVVANGAVFLLLLVPAFAPDDVAAHEGARGLVKLFLAAGLLVGPVVASALGFMAGSTLGAFLALRARAVTIARAAAEDLPFVLSLLEECALPAEGVKEHFARFLVARRGDERIGCVGMEVYGEHVLLRSLAVARRARNAGVGAALLARAIEAARREGGRTAWGLTTFGKKGLFDRFGFRVVPRSGAPPALSPSSQFRGVCPESAVLIALAL